MYGNARMLRDTDYPPRTVPPALKRFVYVSVTFLAGLGAYNALAAAIRLIARTLP